MASQRKSSGSKFRDRLESALGDGAARKFSVAIGKDFTTVWRWASGQIDVPDYALALVEFLETCPVDKRPERWT